ncbi:uncharacterized protein LOC123548642 [Mercenaria mercenaria]|uniref:uncharacterized protein LOC123548642 n=1 Tax=Mercenaria mercenaria TaxID=6596 RepID=UPI00234F82B9|nr:uncharacterized protein LOC123548642 [Mercenaria mercenaria]
MAVAKQDKAEIDISVLEQLLYSQKEAARFLHIGYLSLREFPEVAEQIRMSADKAQTQHMMTVGLIKEFKITANHVITRTVPILKTGIEKKSTKVVQATLGKLLEYVNNMIRKTENTKHEYALIKNKVQQNISSVKKKQMEVKKEGTVLDSDITLQMQELEAAKSEYWDLQAEREKAEKEIDELYQKRHHYLDQTVPSEEERQFNAAVDNLLLPGLAMEAVALAEGTAIVAAGTTAALTAALLPGAILVGGWMYNSMRREEERNRAFQASEQVAEDLKLKQERDDKARERILAIKEDSIRKIAMIKGNFVNKAFLGNPESLVQAKIQLENVGKHFQQILEVWIHFAAQLNHLSQSKDDAELMYIGFEDNPEGFAKELNQSVDEIKRVWQGFMDGCTEYQTESDQEKHQLYGFLTEPVDELSIEECERKRDAILAKMETDLENLTVGFIGRTPITYE